MKLFNSFIAADVLTALELTCYDVSRNEVTRQLKWSVSDRNYLEQVARFLAYATILIVEQFVSPDIDFCK